MKFAVLDVKIILSKSNNKCKIDNENKKRKLINKILFF